MVKKYVFRSFVIVGWIAVIFGFLFLPNISKIMSRNAINVFMWSGVVDPQLFKEFEQQTGIPVNVTYFGGNEELIVKLLATKSKGYDLLVPSDYAVSFLIKHNLLKKLDKSRLRFFNKINHKLMGHYFDPDNDYSIPFEWYVLGIGINKGFYKNGVPAASWSTIFDVETMPHRVGLINDSRELIGLSIFHKYGELRPISGHEIEEIKQMLIKQKRKVEAYTDFRGDFLLETGNCPVVMVGSTFIWKSLRDNPKLDYLIPEEGTFLGLENFVIPAASDRQDDVYKLINYLFDPEVQRHNYEYFSFCPTRSDAEYMFDEPALKSVIPLIHPDTPQQAMPFYNVLTDEQVNEIWLAVKGS